MSIFPATSVTLIEKIRNLSPGNDSAAWVRFWDTYAGAIRIFAARKGGEDSADDIMMTVLGKLVIVLREGKYNPEKGAFHSYLASMIVNEVHMLHRKEMVRCADKRVSLDMTISGDNDGKEVPLVDTLADGKSDNENIDEDWRQAILASAVEHVLTKTALSERDRNVYREYAQEGKPINEVAEKYRISKNSVSQIKTRIEILIVSAGRELLTGFNRI